MTIAPSRPVGDAGARIRPGAIVTQPSFTFRAPIVGARVQARFGSPGPSSGSFIATRMTSASVVVSTTSPEP